MAKKKAKEYKRDSEGKENPGYLNEQQVRAIISNELINLREPMRLAGGTLQAGNLGTGLVLGRNGIEQGSDASIQGWGNTMTFSAVDADTVQWSAGTVTLTDGSIYSIEAGNTGNMSALTYIYFDANVSLVALQTTTTQATAVGRGKILVAVAQNNATVGSEATFQVFGGSGGLLLKADNIAANAITANEIAANTITASQISASGLTGALIQTAASGYRAVMTSANGFQLYNGATYLGKMSCSASGSVIIDSLDNIYFRDQSVELAHMGDDGFYLPAGHSIYFASGTTITDTGSECRFDRQVRVAGTIYPSSDENHNCGASDKKWNNVYAQVLWQQTNTDGSRQVYDFAYIEKGLIDEKILKKAEKISKGLQNTNGFVPGLKLNFKKGTVLKWNSGGLKESKKETDFVVAIADENGLPIVLGAEPVRVIGKAKIGDFIVPSDQKGCAKSCDYPQNYEVIGRCLENKKDTKEGLVKVMIKF